MRTSLRTRLRLLLLPLIAALALGACSKAPGQSADPATSSSSSSSASSADPATETPVAVAEDTPDPSATPAVAHGASTNVQAKSDLKVYAQPDGKKVVTTLKAKTGLGSKTTLLVLDQRDGWFHVALPTRPNGSTGWVKAGDVNVRQNDVSVTVDLTARTVRVFKGDKVAIESPIAIGAADTATPAGDFYVTDFLQTPDAKGAYGPFAFGLSGHSDTLTEFAGGDGQIGIHGTNDPSSIGQAVSHGCVRLPNDVITLLANTVTLGTPVHVA